MSVTPRIVPVEERKQIIPDDAIRSAFMRREDIVGLDPEERERRWVSQLARIDQLREFLATLPSIVIE